MNPPLPTAAALHAFEACGIELEYALVQRDGLDVAPLADEALRLLAGTQAPVTDVDCGMFGWSNELVLHVLELKNVDPTVPMELLPGRFEFEVRQMDAALASLGARLMPSGMHPWMAPRTQTRLWPHANAEIYRAYDRIFDCRSHGYANLQSMHVNLPFAGDDEFARLHDAIRLALPILPALAASSPFIEGGRAASRCQRMAVYRSNALQIPEVTGAVVPDRSAGRRAYERDVLQPMYTAIAAHDGDGLMQHEWLNARGAIARFQRNAIEIRILDTQECPRMDLGVAALVVDLVQALYEDRFPTRAALGMATPRLEAILDACVRDAEAACIGDGAYLAAFGLHRAQCSAGDLWEHIGARLQAQASPRLALWRAPLDLILTRGTLACRLLARAGAAPTRARLRAAYMQLCDALASGTPID